MGATLTVLLGAIPVLILFLVLKYKQARKYWQNAGVFEFEPPGIMDVMWRKTITFAEMDVRMYQTVKPKKFGGCYEIWKPALYVTDLELMKHILVKDFDHFVNRRVFEVRKSDPHAFYSLFNQTNEDWKALRTKMSPTFTTGKIRRMFNIFRESSKNLVAAISTTAIGKEEVDLRDLTGKITMEVIASAAFGIETNLFKDPDSYFMKMGLRFQQQFLGPNIWKMLFLTLAPSIAERFNVKMTDGQVDDFFSKVIVDCISRRTSSGEKRDDFLQLMIEAQQGVLKQEDESQLDEHEKTGRVFHIDSKAKIEFTDDVIIAQSLLFLQGGFDTVESLLLWALYAAAMNPEAQERLYHEVKSAFDDTKGDLTYDAVNGMDYLDRFIQETLRMYPPIMRVERTTVKPYRIPDTDIVIPKGVLVGMPIHGLHHDPELWPEPEKFDPDRFTKENVSKRHPLAYNPFGTGPRNCIARRFAIVECKVILAYLISNFKFTPSGKTMNPVKFASTGILKPADGMWLNVSLRKEE